MPSPFLGMDPYVERPEIWPDFHDSLIACIRGALQPQLKPRYVALTQDRLYVVEAERPIRPDVAVLRTSSPAAPSGGVAAVADKAAVFTLQREAVREPLIHIIEPAAGNRVVTAIEVLSPDNKAQGPGRVSYLRKREEFWENSTNLVEIDLLHEGKPTVRLSEEKLANLRPWHYLVAVTRVWPTQQEVYAFPLQGPLPRVAIPLADEDKDVVLDLPAVFTRCWDEGPYPHVLFYGGPPPGKWSAEEIAWCEQQLRQAGYRPESSTAS
jgi:hypothetical protein